MLVTLASGLKSCAEMRGVTPPACAFPSFSRLFPAFFAESRNSVCHAVEGDDEPSVVVGLGDAAVFEKVFYVRSRRDAVRRSDSMTGSPASVKRSTVSPAGVRSVVNAS